MLSINRQPEATFRKGPNPQQSIEASGDNHILRRIQIRYYANREKESLEAKYAFWSKCKNAFRLFVVLNFHQSKEKILTSPFVFMG